MVLRNEELRHQPYETLQQVCDFLDVDATPLANIKPKKVHIHPYLSPISKKEKAYLRHVFEDEILSLERVLDWDCSNWLSG